MSSSFRIFKRNYVTSGQRRTSPNYHVDFRDHLGRERRLAGFSAKSATYELGQNLIRLVRCAQHREWPDAELMMVIRTWPDRIRKRMLAWGLLDAQRDAETRPIHEHVEQWRRHLDLEPA